MKKLLSLLVAVMLLCSLTVTAFADTTIDLTRTGSVNLWKYDLSSAQADGVWDSSYVSTGVRDQSGVEAILGASGSSSGYAIEGVVYTYLKVAELKSITVTDNDVEDFIKAANIMLAEKGIAPLKVGPITRKRMELLMKEKEERNNKK